MTPRPPLLVAARELLRFLDAECRPACLIGGIAVSRWGEPRNTRDVDATILADFGEEIAVLDRLLSHFRSRDADPAEFTPRLSLWSSRDRLRRGRLEEAQPEMASITQADRTTDGLGESDCYCKTEIYWGRRPMSSYSNDVSLASSAIVLMRIDHTHSDGRRQAARA
jgi:hypothetical protein